MKPWHVIARIGETDLFEPHLSADTPRIYAGIERRGDRSKVRNNVNDRMRKRAGRVPPPTASDLLTLAMTAYCADLRIPRATAEDRWTRQLVLHIPVSAPGTWESLKPSLASMLGFLTGDIWDFQFRQHVYASPGPVQPKDTNPEVVCLFSGGLDSLVGAIDLLHSGKRVALVGHHGAGVSCPVQSKVLAILSEEYGDAALDFMFYVQPSKRDGQGEPSMRSRSLLFLSLGVAVASAFGGLPLVVAENGLITLNVPLTKSRTGSLSTRTTHPHFLEQYQQLVTALGLTLQISLPYRFATKGEMLAACKDRTALKRALPHTMSCSHPELSRYRKRAPGAHCGYCVPCIVRGAALAKAKFRRGEVLVNAVTAPPDRDTGSGRDLRAFKMAIERLRNAKPLQFVLDVLMSGPLPQADVPRYASVYHRGINEIAKWLRLRGVP